MNRKSASPSSSRRALLLVAAAGVEARRAARRGEPLDAAAAAQDELRVVARVHLAQRAGAALEDCEEQREVGSERLGARRLAIEGVDEAREVALDAEPRADRRLQARHQQGGADALARDVADEERHLALAERRSS